MFHAHLLRLAACVLVLAVAIAIAGAVTGPLPSVAAASVRATASASRHRRAPLGPMTARHYAPGSNLSASGAYRPGADGFNLADVGSVGELHELHRHVRGLVYLGLCDGVDAAFLAAVRPFVGARGLYGFYLMDEPDPTGVYAPRCPAKNLKAESDWIHAHIRRALTFIVMMNLGTPSKPDYRHTYTWSNTHIDLFGLDPYPCQPALHGCDYRVITRAVRAAIATGIARRRLVPVYQAFGGGGYSDWTLPNAAQERTILATWAKLTPRPQFDYAYSWGRQEGDRSLVDSPALRAVFAAHNGAHRTVSSAAR